MAQIDAARSSSVLLKIPSSGWLLPGGSKECCLYTDPGQRIEAEAHHRKRQHLTDVDVVADAPPDPGLGMRILERQQDVMMVKHQNFQAQRWMLCCKV
jgi:hypothetical protein